MPVHVLFLGISTFGICLAAHVLLWRFHPPHHHVPALFALFSIGGMLLLCTVRIHFDFLSGTDWTAVVLLHAAMSSAYIQLYPAGQARSPSAALLIAVGQSMPRGMNEAEIRHLLDPEKAFHERLKDLAVSGLIRNENGKLSLTARGRAFILPFLYYRRMLGIPEGKG